MSVRTFLSKIAAVGVLAVPLVIASPTIVRAAAGPETVGSCNIINQFHCCDCWQNGDTGATHCSLVHTHASTECSSTCPAIGCWLD
jgi:hypothetical protein